MKTCLAVFLAFVVGCSAPPKHAYTIQRTLHEGGSYIIFTCRADKDSPSWREDVEPKARQMFTSFFVNRSEPHEFTSIIVVDLSNGWAAVAAVVGTRSFVDKWAAKAPYDVWIALRKNPDVTIQGRFSKMPNQIPYSPRNTRKDTNKKTESRAIT